MKTTSSKDVCCTCGCKIKRSVRFAPKVYDKLISLRLSQEQYAFLMKDTSVHAHAIRNLIDEKMRLAEHGYE